MSSRITGPLSEERGVTLAELVVTLALFALIMIGVVMTWTKAQEAYFVGSETAEVQQNVRAAIDFMVRELRSTGRDITVCAFDYQDPVSAAAADCDSGKVTLCTTTVGGTYANANSATCPAGISGRPNNGCGCIFAIPYAEATATTIRIRSDRNGNGTVVGFGNSSGDGAEEDVKYALASGGSCPPGVTQCITRDDGTGPVAMVAVDINGFTLTYYPRPGFGPCAGVANPCPNAFTLPFTTQPAADQIARIAIMVNAVQTVGGTQVSRTLRTDVVLKNRQ